MDEQVKKEVLVLLQQSLVAVQQDDIKTLRDLSNRIIHSAGIYQDESVILVSVVVYGLSKVLERSDYRAYRDWGRFHHVALTSLQQAAVFLQQNNEQQYVLTLQELLKSLDSLGSKLRVYVQDVMHQAHINKASRFYEHGVSVGRTAKLLGVSPWDLMDYVGSTGIADVEENMTLDVGRRLKFARGLFR